jgi:uncharacterized protein YndB with AHSA1/START domain
MSEVTVMRRIAAAPETVFSFFTDADRWIAWQGVEGEIDATPGGALRIRMPGGQTASGEFVEVVPNRRLVFTWGWEGDAPPIAPGTSTVVIELEPDEAGTLLRLTHAGLVTREIAEHHRLGWERYLDRLATRAGGGDPGPDSP